MCTELLTSETNPTHLLTKRLDVFGPFESLENAVLMDAPGCNDGDPSKDVHLQKALERADVVMCFSAPHGLNQDTSTRDKIKENK